jgi:hypothetical protein
VECREDIDEKGNRIYIVGRFELSPKSWVRGETRSNSWCTHYYGKTQGQRGSFRTDKEVEE